MIKSSIDIALDALDASATFFAEMVKIFNGIMTATQHGRLREIIKRLSRLLERDT